MEQFSLLISKKVIEKDWKPRLCSRSEMISHLLKADDVILFTKATRGHGSDDSECFFRASFLRMKVNESQ